MKKFEFETSKGKFVLVDVDYHDMMFIRVLDKITAHFKGEEMFEYVESIKIDYGAGGRSFNYPLLGEEIESLYLLLESNKKYLFENPIPQPEYQIDNFGNGGVCETWIKEYNEAEQNTFYNPYIFKL